MRISFLFWNLNKRSLEALVAALAVEYQLQVIALVECNVPAATVIRALENAGLPGFTSPESLTSTESDLKLFVRLTGAVVNGVYEDPNNHVVIRRIVFDKSPDMLLAVVHSQSKLNWSDKDQFTGAIRLARNIEDKERYYNHRRTILVGDFNMNPFEEGVVGSDGLHGVMTKVTARRGSRTVDGVERPFFYNPMWRFFGERPDGPPGTGWARQAPIPRTCCSRCSA